MAVPSWPAGLPYRPQRSTFDMGRRYAPAAVAEFEEGPTRQRRSSSSVWTQLVYQLRFTQEQWEIADTFVVQTLAQGTGRFTMPVGRPYAPDPWPAKLVYLEGGVWKGRPTPGAPMRMIASFTLNVLDW